MIVLFLSGDDGNEAGCDAPAEYDDDDDDDDFGGGVDEGLDFGSAEVLEPIGINWAEMCYFWQYFTVKEIEQNNRLFKIQTSQ